jgi:hypothetical protein
VLNSSIKTEIDGRSRFLDCVQIVDWGDIMLTAEKPHYISRALKEAADVLTEKHVEVRRVLSCNS